MENNETVSKNLKKKLTDIEDANSDIKNKLKGISDEAEQYSGTIGILKKLVELHANDLQRWSTMLEGNSSVGDVDSVVLKLKNENDSKSPEERINAILAMLDKENEALDKLYENKVKEVNEPKKKPAVKKPTVKK